MKQVYHVSELPRNEGEKFVLPEGHKVEGCYARNGYPDGVFKLIPADPYKVVAMWGNQMMVAHCSEEDDSYCSSKHRYVILLD